MSKDAAADVPVRDVSVIIVNYGTADLALEAVASVLGHSDRVRDIHLVDNASPGGDARDLARAIAARNWQGRVTLHAETTNHGFGRGNNLAIAALAKPQPEFVFLLNPDARLGNDTIRLLAEFLDAHPQAGAAGARIEKPGADGSLQPVTAAFRFPSLIATFAGAMAFGPVSRLCARWQVPLGADLTTSRVDWVAGAAVMLRMDALREAGLFDRQYFLYYEEVDLMRQLAAKGWQTWYVAEALVIHAEGAATGVKSGRAERRRLPAYWYQSWRYYMRKNHGWAIALLACLAWGLGAALNHALSWLRGKEPAAPLHFFPDLWAHALRPLLGLADAA
ncbi:MAG: glycosyltransferase family 2 protein [Cypionkella sp.]